MSRYEDAEAEDEDGEEDAENSDSAVRGGAREKTDDEDMDERMLDLPEKVLVSIKKIMDRSRAKTFGELSNNEKEQVRKKVHNDDDRVQREFLNQSKRSKNKAKSQNNTPKKRAFFNAFGEDGEGGEDGDSKRDKGLRPEPRKLSCLPQMGLGSSDMCSKLRGVAGNHRRVFFKREDLLKRDGVLQVDEGPFGLQSTFAWWLNSTKQRYFAECFATPVHHDMALRTVESDTVTLAPHMDWCASALFAFVNTHKTTHLDIPRSQEIESICLPQFHGDRKSRMLIEGGPKGGTVGVADCHLWKISKCEDTLTVDPEILQIITFLCKALKGGLDELYPAVATEYTEPMVATNSKGKVQDGGRYFDEYCADMLKARGERSMACDIDYEMIDRICTCREAVAGRELEMNDDLVVPVENSINTEALRGHEIPSGAQPHEIILKKGLVDVFLWSHVMDGEDANGHIRQMRVDMVRLVARMPGVEPIIFLENASKMDGMCVPLLSVLKHMGMVLRRNQAMTMSMGDAFSVGKKAQLSSMCSEAHVPLAVFHFADAEGLRNVSLGGMRMDVRNQEEMQAYAEYLQGVQAARNEHYRMISAGVAADLMPHGVTHSRKPMATYSTQFYEGIHYRAVATSMLEERTAELLDNVRTVCIHNLEDVQDAVDCLMGTVLRSSDGLTCYMDVGGGMAWNCGILIKYNPDAFTPYCKPNSRNKSEAAFEFTPQPFKCAPIIEVYMESRGAGNDQFACLWDAESTICLDLAFLKEHKTRLNAQLTAFVDHVHDYATSATIQGLQQTRMQEEELLALYGVSEHKVHQILAQCQRGAELEGMARILDSQIRQSVKTALSLMCGGMLLQFEMAALAVRDLKKLEEERGHEWVQDSRPMRAVVEGRLRSPAADLLNAETHTAFFYRLSDQRLAMDICFMNHSLVELYNAGTCANFCSDNAWGMPVQLTDGASTWSVMVTLQTGAKAEYVHNKKESGAGADVSGQIKTQNDNAHGKFNCVSAKVTQFAHSTRSLCKSARHISLLGMATYNGSGVAVGADGAIRMDNKKDRDEAGLTAYFCELRKHNGDSDHSQNFPQNVENWVAHSDAGAGTSDECWTTTENLKGIVYKQFWSIPIVVLTGNRQESKVPTSTIDGGRMRVANSSVLDGLIGRIFGDKEECDEDVEEPDPDVHMRDVLVVSEDVTDVKYMTEERARKNKIYCLISMIKRKAFPFTNRVLTLKFLRAHYVMDTDLRTLGNNVRDMSSGLRRAYFRSSTVMNRTWDGPFKLVTLHPTAVTYTAERCIQAALAATYHDAKGAPHVPLYAAFEDMIVATLGVPISLQCVLSALHLWMFATVLDVSVMILSLYFLFMTGLQKHCPLNILALVATEQALSPAEEVVYESFARYLLEMVTMPVLDVARVHWASPGARRQRGAGLQMSGHFKEASREEVIGWHNFAGDGRYHELKSELQKRAHKQVPSAFVSPGVEFVVTETPEWMVPADAARNSKTRGEAFKFDPFVMGSADSIIASAFGSMQTRAHDEAREARDGRPLRLRERTDAFWQAAHLGTRLPQVNRKTMDSNDLNFAPAWTTAVFYNNVRKNTTGLPGVVRHFLALCNMKANCSRADLMQRLLGRYMRKHAVRREFLKNQFWSAPILGEDEYTCFKWGVMPREGEGGDAFEGVQVSLNVDIVWLVLSQALYAHEWQGREADGSEAVVHLRALSSCSLTMLSLFIHTQIERAAIPANNGSIFLNHMNPVLSCPLPAALCYDARLHVDAYLANNSERLGDNMLCNRMRRPQHFQLLVLDGGLETLYYKSVVAAAEKNSCPETAGDLFPLPPESVAHMQSHFTIMNTAFKRLSAMPEVPAEDKTLQIAFQIYGSSVTSDMVRYIPTTLTQCAIQDGREVPCMTFARGYMFTFSVKGNSVVFSPVVASGVHETATLSRFCDPASRLPLVGERSCSVEHMGVMMARGLQLKEGPNGKTVSIASQMGTSDSYEKSASDGTVSQVECEDLPFALFPVVHWKHAVRVRCRDLILRLKDFPQSLSDFAHTRKKCDFGGVEPHLRLVPVHTYYDWTKREGFLREAPVLAEYLGEHKGVPEILDRACVLHLVRFSFPDYNRECFFVARRVFGQKLDNLLFFNGLEHLKYHLQETRGHPFDEVGTVSWPAAHRHLLVAGRCLYNPYDSEYGASLALMHRIVSVDGGATFAVHVHEHVEQGDGKLTSELVCAVELGASVAPEWTLGPVDHWHEDGPEGLGVVLKHPRSNQYLRNGQYYVECRLPLSQEPVRGLMDFVTASRCFLREGQEVFLRLSTARYRELCACISRPMAKAFDLRVLSDTLDEMEHPADENEDFMELRAFYILGDDSVASTKMHTVKLAHTAQSLNLMDSTYFYNEQSKHKVIFNARLVTADHKPIVTLQSDEALEHFTHLVYRTHVPSGQPRTTVADQRELWP